MALPPATKTTWINPLAFGLGVPQSKKPSLVFLQLKRSRRGKHRRRNDDDDEEEDEDETTNMKDKEIPQLPTLKSSSLSDSSNAMDSQQGIAEDGEKSSNSTASANSPFVLKKKFQLQYTCNICEARNTHFVSRMAYAKGVVITTCKGCKTQHLIADHLGWTQLFANPTASNAAANNNSTATDGGTTTTSTTSSGIPVTTANTIEDYFAQRGLHNAVNRVSPEVFDLERMLEYDAVAKSGSIVGDDGKPALE